MQHWVEAYPHSIFASVLLLDNKIEQWQIGPNYWKSPFEVSTFRKKNRLNDYKTEFKEFVANTPEDHDRVFLKLAPEWFKQWQLVKNYQGYRPYETEKKVVKFNKIIDYWNFIPFVSRCIQVRQRGRTAQIIKKIIWR